MSLDTSARPFDPHVPLALLALSFSIYLFAQTRSVEAQKDVLRYQIQSTKTQDDNLVKLEKQLKDVVARQEATVKQSQEVRLRFQSVLSDLVELAKEDKDAKEIVETLKIQRSGSDGSASSSTAPGAGSGSAGSKP